MVRYAHGDPDSDDDAGGEVLLEEGGSDESRPRAPEEDWPEWRKRWREFVRNDPRFSGIVMAAILLNCVSLAAEDPTDTDHSGTAAKVNKIADPIFLSVYVCEMLAKFVALGLFIPRWPGPDPPAHLGGYFRDRWNLFDFVVVVGGVVALFLGGATLGAVRALRVLRPLSAVSRAPQIRILVVALVTSVRRLGNVLILFAAFLLIGAITAVQLWQGLLRRRCVHAAVVAAAEASGLEPAQALQLLRADALPNASVSYDTAYPPDLRSTVCRKGPSVLPGGFVCPWRYQCVEVENPMLGQEHFDNVGAAVLALFVAVTLEGWVDTMYRTMDATDSLSAVFFVAVVVFGAFFTVNLALVVITSAFERLHDQEVTKLRAERDMLRRERERLRLQQRRSGSASLVAALSQRLLDRASLQQRMRDRIRGPVCVFDEGDEAEVWHEERWLDCVVIDTSASPPASPVNKLTGPGPEMEPTFSVLLADGSTVAGIALSDLRSVPSAPWRRSLRSVCRSTWFNVLMNCTIGVSTLALAVDHHGQSDSLDTALWLVNVIATSVFGAELLVKVLGLGVWDYCSDGWNVFDATVVVVSVVDVTTGHDGSFSAIRSLRILRVLRLSSRFGALQRWLAIILKSLQASAVLAALMFLLMFISALIGMQILGNKMCGLDDDCAEDYNSSSPGCGCVPRENFDSFWSAWLTCFQILTGEDWQVILYKGMAAGGWGMSLYFVSYFVVGNYVVLNLFIAILLNQAGQNPEEDEKDAAPEPEAEAVEEGEVPLLEVAPKEESSGWVPKLAVVVEHRCFEAFVLAAISGSTVVLALEDPYSPPDSRLSNNLEICDVVFTACFTLEAVLKIAAYGLVLRKDSYLRRDAWNRLDFVIVLASLLALAAQDHPGSDHLTIFRVFRTLRPLRFLGRSEAMRVAVMALVRSMPALVNVFFISGLIWAIWGIVAVQMFKGSFYACSDKEYGDVTGSVNLSGRVWDFTKRVDCLAFPAAEYRWQNYSYHFDNILASILALFVVASLEGWVTVMYLGMDAVSHDQAPVRNHRPLNALFFVLFVVAGAFFIVNLFVGVLLDTYASLKRGSGGERMLLSDAQRKWVASYRSMLRGVQRPAPFLYAEAGVKPPWHVGVAQSIVGHERFEPCVQFSIVLSVITIATEHFQEPGWLQTLQTVLGFLFIVLFTLEAALKITAYGWKGYWEQRWNRYDFLVVVVGWPAAAVAATEGSTGSVGVAGVFRVLRLARLARMAKSAKGVHLLLKTLFLSLPSLLNVVGIVSLIFFVFAVIGMRFFGRVRWGPSMGRYANFSRFDYAMLLLVRLCTGGGWNGVMADCRVQSPECDERLDECGSDPLAVTFFVLFTLSGMYVLLNLFIAVILDSFEDVVSDAQRGELRKRDMAKFNAVWRCFDPRGTFRIDAASLPSLLRRIGPPLGVPPETSWAEATRVVSELDLTVVDGMVDMQPLLQALFCRFSGFPDEISLPSSLVAEVSKKADKRFLADRRDKEYELAGKEALPAAAAVGVIHAQALLRGAIARRQVRAYRRGGPYPPCVDAWDTSYVSPRLSPTGSPLSPMGPLAALTNSPRRAAAALGFRSSLSSGPPRRSNPLASQGKPRRPSSPALPPKPRQRTRDTADDDGEIFALTTTSQMPAVRGTASEVGTADTLGSSAARTASARGPLVVLPFSTPPTPPQHAAQEEELAE